MRATANWLFLPPKTTFFTFSPPIFASPHFYSFPTTTAFLVSSLFHLHTNDPKSTLHRLYMDPHRPYMDPYRPYIDLTSTPHRPYIQLLFHQSLFVIASIMNSEATYYHLGISFVSPPPPQSPPDFCPFPTTTTTTLLLFSLHHHHHISIVLPLPPPPPQFCCFPSSSSFSFLFLFYQTGYLSLAYVGLNLAF